jgi:hypothetical protein
VTPSILHSAIGTLPAAIPVPPPSSHGTVYWSIVPHQVATPTAAPVAATPQSSGAPAPAVTEFALRTAARAYAVAMAPVILRCRHTGVPYADAMRPQTAHEAAGDLLLYARTIARTLELARSFAADAVQGPRRKGPGTVRRRIETVALLEQAQMHARARWAGSSRPGPATETGAPCPGAPVLVAG